MYERFTDRARKVMQLANQEAQRFNHEYIGTEHILLGLVKEGTGVAANVLKNLDVDLRKIRLEVEKLVQSGPRHGHDGQAARRRRGPRRSSNTRSKRPATSTTTTSAPSTCCSACCASRRAWPPRC